jgi:hypothetical protein
MTLNEQRDEFVKLRVQSADVRMKTSGNRNVPASNFLLILEINSLPAILPAHFPFFKQKFKNKKMFQGHGATFTPRAIFFRPLKSRRTRKSDQNQSKPCRCPKIDRLRWKRREEKFRTSAGSHSVAEAGPKQQHSAADSQIAF